MALIITTENSIPNFESLILRQEELHLAYPNHAFSAEVELSDNSAILNRLDKFNFISPPKSIFLSRMTDFYYHALGLRASTVCQASSFENYRYLLNQQFACGFFPAPYIKKEDTFAHLPLSPSAYFYLAIVYKANPLLSQAINDLILLQTFSYEQNNTCIMDAFTGRANA